MQIQEKSRASSRVLVVGGGLAGIRTALDLAEAERDVLLIDPATAIGGLMTQLDRTFPTNNCDLCTLSPHLSEVGRRRHIQLKTMTRVAGVEGEAGDFTVTLRTAPRYIDLEKCTACGECHQKFPQWVHFTPGLDHRAPTCMRYPQATPEAFVVDMERCTDVDALVGACPAGAILPADHERTETAVFAAIVLAPGAALFDPRGLDYFGYAQQPDVVTSLEFERILSASGPTLGRLVRPSDGKMPRSIAWIQCVGSRGLQKGAQPYCSSACCMFSLKEAIVTKERFQDDIGTTIFFMDMRTFGKDYERYLNRAESVHGIRLVRGRPHSVFQTPEGDALSVTYAPHDDSVLISEAFDMVVLSTGFRIPESLKALAGLVGIELNAHDFAKTAGFSPVTTSRPGVYVCGLFESPKDIPETMIQASAAAGMAARHLAPAAGGAPEADQYPRERDVSAEAPRVGVFICDCGDNIGGVIDVESLAQKARGLAGVHLAEGVGHGCSREAMARIEETIRAAGLNRVVLAGCSPRTHESRFQDVLRRAGLNKYLLEIANIRDQATWVHYNSPRKAAEKAFSLVAMAVAAVLRARPLTDQTLPMNKDILVVGGGVAGMTAALNLADQGFKVFLAERSDHLGGLAAGIRRTLEGEDVRAHVAGLVQQTLGHPNVQVITRAIIVDHSGMPGMFSTGMQVGPQMFYRQIRHGVTIMATGALAARPHAYLLGRHAAVMTQLEADALIEDDPQRVRTWENVVMIQCVGSRCEDNPNCSRVCCQAAIKNALRILDTRPDARIFILYRDIRTYGFQEDYYREARERGVTFVHYEPQLPPEVTAAGARVEVTFTDPVLGRPISVAADSLCLSTGFVSDDEAAEDLAMIFKLPRTGDGFLMEDHVKLRPVDLPLPGFFVAGTAHAPKTIRESISQAQAAAARALTLLARDVINLGAAVARVNADKCAACLVCVRACPFGVPFINAEGRSEIDPAKCHGCGICAAECPAKAIQLMQFEDDQILAKLEGLMDRMVA